MTKQECIENHRKMWNWIADETEKRKDPVSKEDYFKYVGVSLLNRPFMDCYACESCEGFCKLCLFDWEITHYCHENDSYYESWWFFSIIELDYKKAAHYARKIANLPEREERT